MRFVDILTLIAALSNFGIGIFVIFHNWRRPLYIAFSIFSFITGIWAITNFLFYYFPSRFLIESQYATGALVFPFAIVWFGLLLGKRLNRIFLLLLAVLSFLAFLSPYIGNLIIEEFTIGDGHNYFLKLSNFFNLYSLFPILVYILLVVWIVRAFIVATGLKKLQLRYILAGSIIFGGISTIISFVLPLFKISIVAPVDAQSSLVLVGFSTYAIIRHRLLDIRLVISRSILYVLLLAIVAFLFTLNIFLVGPLFGDTFNAKLVVTILSTLAIVFGLDPLKKLIARLTDKVFFKAPINYNEVLRVLSERISVEVDLGELNRGVQDDMARTLKLHHAEVLIISNLGDLCRRNPSTGEMDACMAYNDPALEHLQVPGKFIDRDGLERKIEDTKESNEKEVLVRALESVDKLQAAFIAPITARGRLNAALVLGRKLSGDSFNAQEINLFKVLGPQIGSAIEKAKLFEQVKHFSQKLQIEIDRATGELKERNRFLLALQDITSLITHTLDYKKVTQEIVDGIAKKLGYVAGLLLLRDKETGVTWAEAVTETAVTRAAFKLLPIPVSSFRGSINDPDLASEAMRTGEVTESDDLAKFLHPPIPTAICHALQKATKVKYVVAVPIVIEDEIIGSLVYTIGKPGNQISSQERAMMKSLADQTGIVIRNLRLFEKIEQANHELEKANDHLKILDEAKSEFISIASHQLRTPMTGIMGYLSMLVGGDFGKLDPAVGKILESILAASKRMIRLINIFLNVSKIEAGRFEITKKPTQIENIVDTEFVELQKLAKDKNIQLIFDRPKTLLPEVSVDRDKLADVFQNLIDNAIKYTPEGSVTVSTEIFGTELIVRVKDTGRGLSKSDAEKLFNKFVRGDGIARIHPDGSGLGLYIAKKIVEAHGGRIWVESEGEGKGSSFNFAVPLNS